MNRTSAESGLAVLGDHGPRSVEGDVFLGRRAKAGCTDALNELVEAHGGFVIKVALEYRNLGLSMEDLLGEGNVGLMEAARRYDPERGCKFVTYAMWWIRKSVLDALNRHSNVLAISGYYRRKLREIRETDRELEATLGRRPDRHEIDASLHQPAGRVETLLGFDHQKLSLDESPEANGSLALADRIEDSNGASPEEQLIRRETRTLVREAVNALDARQRRVIRLRFGLEGRDPYTLTEIGEAMGLSRERIRQIENAGKQRLRRLLAGAQRRANGDGERPAVPPTRRNTAA